jgi:guanylate kinase
VVSAPSGTGKTTICRQVVERDAGLCFSVSHTTRPRRAGEKEGVDYHFVSDAEFARLAEQGAFLEWAVYNGRRYGTTARALEEQLARGRDVLLEIEVQGARQVRKRRADSRSIFLLPPSWPELRRRLEARGTDGADEIERRLKLAREEFQALDEFDYAVINDRLETSVSAVLEIIQAERDADTASVLRRFHPDAARSSISPER